MIHRHAEELAVGLDNHHLRHSHRKRQRDANRSSLVQLALDHHCAVELFYRRAHYVHAHAATGEIGDNRRGGETGGKDQVDGRAVVDALQSRFVNQSFFIGFALNDERIDSLAVIDDLYDHAIGLLLCANGQLAGLRLARRPSDLWRFKAVIEAVAHNVNQRVG